MLYTTVTLNTDYSGCVHRDHNEGPTYMAVFGDYTGGELKVWPRDAGNRMPGALSPHRATTIDTHDI
eukprot:8877086-Prorocentrum_lima.AAC.1